MNSKKRPILMVSSAVYGYQEFLDRVYDLLVNLGYEVWMSHKGTIPVDSNHDTIECCLDAVRRCDLFLGIITGKYGKTERRGLSATHLEFREAIRINKLRWFLVDDRVVFARNLLRHLYSSENCDTPLERRTLRLKGFNQFDDLRLIDMYEEACGKKCGKAGEKRVDWVQTYSDDGAALLFAESQFSRYLELEEMLRRNLADKDYVLNRMKEKGTSDE